MIFLRQLKYKRKKILPGRACPRNLMLLSQKSEPFLDLKGELIYPHLTGNPF